MSLETLIPELNKRILALAPKHFKVSDSAPQTFEALKREYAETGVIHVWSGASDTTIYGDASVNHAMRAWHDALHVELDADFTLDGERRVALRQAELIGCSKLAPIILAEVLGQVEYFQTHGQFPKDQLAFVKAYLNNKQLAISSTF